MVNVIIADNHPTWRSGLRGLLQKDESITVVAEASDGKETLRLVKLHHPDVLLLDMNMPKLDGTEVLEQLFEIESDVAVVIVSAYDDDVYKQAAQECGAAGYLTKDQRPDAIREAVLAAAKGEGRWMVRPANLKPFEKPFTERELTVLRLVASGKDTKEISKHLNVSEHTVKNHLRSIYDHIGVHKMHQAVAWAWKHGILERESPSKFT